MVLATPAPRGFVLLSRCVCAPVGLRSCNGLDAAAGAVRDLELAVDDLDAGERIVVHAGKFTELAGIVDAGQRGGEVDRVRVAEPRANVSAEPVLDLAGLADACGGERVTQAAEL